MKTGFDLAGDTSEQINQYTQAMINIVTPVLEKGMILACEYSKACGRTAVLVKDLEYSMKYCARYEVGQRVGSYFPDLDDDDDDAISDIVEGPADDDEEDSDVKEVKVSTTTKGKRGRKKKSVEINL